MMKADILEDGLFKADILLYTARAKLDNFGSIGYHFEFVSDPKRIQRMIERLQVHVMEGNVQLVQKKKRRFWQEKGGESKPFIEECNQTLSQW